MMCQVINLKCSSNDNISIHHIITLQEKTTVHGPELCSASTTEACGAESVCFTGHFQVLFPKTVYCCSLLQVFYDMRFLSSILGSGFLNWQEKNLHLFTPQALKSTDNLHIRLKRSKFVNFLPAKKVKMRHFLTPTCKKGQNTSQKFGWQFWC